MCVGSSGASVCVEVVVRYCASSSGMCVWNVCSGWW